MLPPRKIVSPSIWTWNHYRRKFVAEGRSKAFLQGFDGYEMRYETGTIEAADYKDGRQWAFTIEDHENY